MEIYLTKSFLFKRNSNFSDTSSKVVSKWTKKVHSVTVSICTGKRMEQTEILPTIVLSLLNWRLTIYIIHKQKQGNRWNWWMLPEIHFVLCMPYWGKVHLRCFDHICNIIATSNLNFNASHAVYFVFNVAVGYNIGIRKFGQSPITLSKITERELL